MDVVVHIPRFHRGGGVPARMQWSRLSATDEPIEVMVHTGQEGAGWKVQVRKSADVTCPSERSYGPHETKTTNAHADAR